MEAMFGKADCRWHSKFEFEDKGESGMKEWKHLWTIAGVLYLLLGSMMFWNGYSDVDYSRNFLMLAYWEGLDYESFGDTTLGGKILTFDEIYVKGLKWMISGCFGNMLGVAMVCYGLSIKSK